VFHDRFPRAFIQGNAKQKRKSFKMIETERLIIKPLTYGQLVKYTQCDNSLEAELNLNLTSRTISPELKEALEQTILPNVADKNKNYLYSTIWTAISKTENRIVADLIPYSLRFTLRRFLKVVISNFN